MSDIIYIYYVLKLYTVMRAILRCGKHREIHVDNIVPFPIIRGTDTGLLAAGSSGSGATNI